MSNTLLIAGYLRLPWPTPVPALMHARAALAPLLSGGLSGDCNIRHLSCFPAKVEKACSERPCAKLPSIHWFQPLLDKAVINMIAYI